MMRRAQKRVLITIPMALFSLLVMLLGSVAPGASAQDAPAPTVGDIVVDSYDCDTGSLSFHVHVTDLPHIPDSNGSLGYGVNAQYEQGTAGPPGMAFNPEPEDAPYTGDLHLSSRLPSTGAESAFPEDASGPIVSIEIYVGVGYGGGPEPSDSSRMTYPVDCGDPGTDAAPTPSAGSNGEDTGSGDTTSAPQNGTDAPTDTQAANTVDANEAGSGSTADAEATDDTSVTEVAQLPRTGSGTGIDASVNIALFTLLSGSAFLCSFAALRIRHQA